MFLFLCIPFALFTCSCNAVGLYGSFVQPPLPFPKTSYTSLYEQSVKKNVNTVMVSSNGKGYMLQKTSGEITSYSIFDNVDKQMYFLDRLKKNVECWPLQYVSTPWMYDENLYKSSPFAGNRLREEIIDGHNCNVWLLKKKEPNILAKSCFDKDTGCLVLGTYETVQDISTVRLKSYSPNSMSPEYFQIPNNYKLTINGSHTL